MRNPLLRSVALLVLAGVVAISAATLLSSPAEAKGKWVSCPFPPCAAPCVLGAAPTVLCKVPGQKPFKTTFACCCCGGGQALYKPL